MARTKATRKKHTKFAIRGFLRGQIVDSKTGKICGDTGWIENKATNDGLTNLARLLGAVAGSYVVGFAALGTQTAAVDMSQTDVVGRTHSFKALNLSTSGTCTLTCTASFGSASLSGSCNVGAAGLFKTDSASSMMAMQTFATSQWNTNQDFNLTYQLRFGTA
jgi:hypothetical protein